MKKFSTLLMFGCLMVMACVAFAVTGDTTQPLFGWHPEMLNLVLPFIVPFLTSIFSKISWSTEIKRGILAVLCLIATAAIGWLGGFIIKTDLATINVVATLAIVFGVSNGLYMLLAKKVFKPITENVGLTEKKTS